MRPAAYRLAWIPPLLVGASAAISAEVATGILLYAGPGLMRSLTTVLAVEGAALAVGLWSTPSRSGPRLVDRLRRRWLFCLLAYMAAALFGTSWSVVQDLGGGPVGQGLGLAVLAALPLYASGLVLAGMSAVAAEDPLGRLRGPGAAAALGAAAGFVLTGALLPRAPIPASLLVACLVLLSAGGMIYGIVLSSRPIVHVRASRRAAGSDVRVEDRLRTPDGKTARYLLEGGHPRRHVSLEGNGAAPWEVVVARSVLARREGPTRILYVGGGASALPHAVAAEEAEVSVDILERNPAVVELAREHFAAAPPGAAPSGSTRLFVGNLEDLLAEARGPYDLVLVDTFALAPLGGAEGLSRAARAALRSMVAPDGLLAAGPSPDAAGLATGVAGPGAAVAELRRPAEAGAADEEVVVVSRPPGAEPWTDRLGDFTLPNGVPPAP